MTTKESLFDAVAAAFEFPDYFGRNWDALDECLRDLSWLPAGGYLLIVEHAAELWEAAPALAQQLVEVWSEAAEPWGRDAVPFTLVFSAPP